MSDQRSAPSGHNNQTTPSLSTYACLIMFEPVKYLSASDCSDVVLCLSVICIAVLVSITVQNTTKITLEVGTWKYFVKIYFWNVLLEILLALSLTCDQQSVNHVSLAIDFSWLATVFWPLRPPSKKPIPVIYPICVPAVSQQYTSWTEAWLVTTSAVTKPAV